MILLDPREGSKDYEAKLRALGAPVEMTTLNSGDVAFFGSDRAVAIELKKFDDMLSCIQTGRFSGHQLVEMVQDYDEYYVVLEGLWRPNPQDGLLELWSRGGWQPAGRGIRKWMYRDFDAFLSTMEVKGGVRIKRTASEDETARVVYGLYQWWQDFDGHRSHLALNRAGRDVALFSKPTFVRRVASELPGIGYDKAGMIAGAHPTVRQLVNATVQDLTKLPGIGKKLAKGIVEAWDSTS